MVSSVRDLKLSSVVPAKVTGNKDHHLSDTDLSFKLHYIRALYFFHPTPSITIQELKKPMFDLLELCYPASGRIRRSDDDSKRPFIKCNDGGVRVVEAFSDITLDDFLALTPNDRDYDSLVYSQCLGPDLGFSPLLHVQVTWFKCGGICLGLNWAHVLGDPISLAKFVNTWAQLLTTGHVPSNPLHVPNHFRTTSTTTTKSSPVKTVEPVGDLWRLPGEAKTRSHTFIVTAKQLDLIKSKIHDPIRSVEFSDFEVLAAVIWKSLSKTIEESDAGAVTICVYDSNERENEIPSNKVAISTVEADFNPRKSEVSELATLIAEKKIPANSVVEEMWEKDVILYGSRLTFVDMEGVDVYGLKLQGERPVFVNYRIDEVGDEGVVLILRGPDEDGRTVTVTVTLPENHLAGLKIELKESWGLV